jgi:hypothetical protein
MLFLVSFIFMGMFAQPVFRSKSRNAEILLDTTLGGIWAGRDSVYVETIIDTIFDDEDEIVSIDTTEVYQQLNDLVDSTYFFRTGDPDFGDLHIFDLELKMKSLWHGTKVFFLFRHLDDSLVNGYVNAGLDTTLIEGLENRDATAIYLYLDTEDNRLDSEDPVYDDDSYLEYISWFRWIWGAPEFEGQYRGEDISSLTDAGVDMIQWHDSVYLYTKLSIDIGVIAPELLETDTTISEGIAVGFEVELNENDKEFPKNGLFGIQTRAFWGDDNDSLPMHPRNVSKWGWLYFTYGDDYNPVSTYEIPAESFASVYPNPASESITISFENYTSSGYRLFDVMGRLVKTGALEGYNGYIQIQDLQRGAYILVIDRQESPPFVQRILKY